MEDKLTDYKSYLEARQLSQNYFNIMRIWLGYLSKNNIDPKYITQETITKFFQENNNYSINTRNQFIKAGRNYYTFLCMDDRDNEWKKIRLMKIAQKIPDYLSEDEVEKGISYLITNHSRKMTPNKIRALIHFLFYTGSRKEELLTLKRSSFDFKENTVRLFGKGKKERFAYYPKKIGTEIQDYFSSEEEKQNAFNITLGIMNYLPKLMGKYLNKNIYLHLFRHSGARFMADKGLNIQDISRILGHTSITTTMLYLSPSDTSIKNKYKEKMI